MEKGRRKVFAMSGSARTNSTNASLLEWIIRLAGDQFDIELFEKIADLPHFNPDLDNENLPDIITELRHKIHHADGVIICTPECSRIYNWPKSIANYKFPIFICRTA